MTFPFIFPPKCNNLPHPFWFWFKSRYRERGDAIIGIPIASAWPGIIRQTDSNQLIKVGWYSWIPWGLDECLFSGSFPGSSLRMVRTHYQAGGFCLGGTTAPSLVSTGIIIWKPSAQDELLSHSEGQRSEALVWNVVTAMVAVLALNEVTQTGEAMLANIKGLMLEQEL